MSKINPQANLPIALRKQSRTHTTPGHLKDFVGYRNNIENFISYKHYSSIQSHYKIDLEDPKWREAMLDEMRALEKMKHGSS
jgi:hypothetical protein